VAKNAAGGWSQGETSPSQKKCKIFSKISQNFAKNPYLICKKTEVKMQRIKSVQSPIILAFAKNPPIFLVKMQEMWYNKASGGSICAQ